MAERIHVGKSGNSNRSAAIAAPASLEAQRDRLMARPWFWFALVLGMGLAVEVFVLGLSGIFWGEPSAWMLRVGDGLIRTFGFPGLVLGPCALWLYYQVSSAVYDANDITRTFLAVVGLCALIYWSSLA